jgi:tetratricopeptide (TPR) repeat protein
MNMESRKSEQYDEQRNVIQQYMINGQFVEAEREVIRLRREMEEDADVPKDLLSDIYYKQYHLAWIRKDKENAFKFAEKAIELHSSNEAKVQIYANLAMNALQRELLDDAMEYVEKGSSLLMGNTTTTWYLYLIKGKIQLKKGDLDAALLDFTTSTKEANRLHLPHGEIAANICVAETLYLMGLKNNALSEIVRMELYAQRTMQLQQYLRVLIKKAQLLFRMGRNEEAERVILTIPDFND